MSLEIISTQNAPQPIGPYSQAIRLGNLLFTSGQIAIDPISGELVPSSVAEQTHRVLKNLTAVLKAAGTDLNSVVKTTIYLKNMNDFAKVNEVYAEYFYQTAPARSTVEVNRLPKDVLVEIDCIAAIE